MKNNEIKKLIHVVLIEPEIPWNTGNIGRTCLAAGAHLHLVRPLGFQLTEQRLRRSGLDYWAAVNPSIHNSFNEFEIELPSLGEPYFLSRFAKKSLYDVKFNYPAVLIFGSESKGLKKELHEGYAPNFVVIPFLQSPIRSLNLSTSVGIVLYEARRQHEIIQREKSIVIHDESA